MDFHGANTVTQISLNNGGYIPRPCFKPLDLPNSKDVKKNIMLLGMSVISLKFGF